MIVRTGNGDVQSANAGYTRRLHAAALLGTPKSLLAIVSFLAAAVCFILPAALGITFVERGLSGSSPGRGWKSIVMC